MASSNTSIAQVTLFLMTEKGYQVLRHIVEHLDKAVVAQVIGARDKNLTHDYFEEIEALCKQSGIPFCSRLDTFEVKSPYSLAISWRWLIHDDSKLIVLHYSLLPLYRGFAPLVSCLINGESTIGVTALYADAEFDRGDILMQAARAVQYPIRIAQAIILSIECYIDIISKMWPDLQSGQPIPASPQTESGASYSLWRDEDDYRIDWSSDSGKIKRFIDAVGPPYQGASALVNGQLHRILDAEVEMDVKIENRVAGKVLFMNRQQPVVVCGTGLLRITNLQSYNGEKALPLKQFRTRFQ